MHSSIIKYYYIYIGLVEGFIISGTIPARDFVSFNLPVGGFPKLFQKQKLTKLFMND